ncbi:MAG: fibronectin type III domain-containing protein [Dermatophilaceae bacterium]
MPFPLWTRTPMTPRSGIMLVLLSLLGAIAVVPLAPAAAATGAGMHSSSPGAVAAAAATGLVVDTQVATHQSAAATTISSPAMTTSQTGELLLAFVMSDGGASAKQSFSSVSGGDLSWRLRQRANGRKGTSEIWQAVASAPVTNMAVRATRSNGSYAGSIVVTAITGASTDVDGATSAAGGRSAPTATLTPTKAGSWVWGVGNDWDKAVARSVGAGQTMADEYLAPVDNTYWVQRQGAPSTDGTRAAVTLNDPFPTADRWNLALIEIPPATVTPPPTDTSPPVISAVASSAIGQTQASVSWTTSEPATTQVAFGATTAYASSTTLNPALTTSHTQVLSGLTAGTTYHYQVRSVDAAGNGASSPDSTFTTAAATSFNPGNPTGGASVPSGMGLEDVSQPDHVIGDGTPASCTSDAVVSAVTAGGIITFDCGPSPLTITLTQTAKVRNSTKKLVIDGGGKVTLSGGNANRILYVDTCDSSLGSVSGNCLYAPTSPQVSVQNLTFANGNATNSTYVSPGDTNQGSNGGGAIFQLGGRLKVVRSVFQRNTCATNGPDLGGAAIRVLAQHSATPNDLDASYAARNQDPVAIVQSTFGGASGQGNTCSNGGAISGLRTPITVLNSLIRDNNAVGCCANPPKSGTPGGGSGGAIYTDGASYDLTIAGTDIETNTAKAGGSAIFYVSNDQTGHLVIDGSTLKNNTYAPSGQPTDQHFENYPGIFYIGEGQPRITNSTIQ